jgi:molecular chaperone DnaK
MRPVLGIDLGTTYSCVAHLDGAGQAVIVPNSESESTSPSVVYYEEGGAAVVGRHAKSELRRHPDRVVQHIKRRMGEPGFSIELDDRQYYPQQVSAAILEYVVTEALTTLACASDSRPLADVVITVPAYFGSAEREATREAGELAGLNVLRVINEPTSAAIAYGVLGSGEQRRVLVYDLGGGTFDVTVMETSPSRIRAIATNGSQDLGGAMWDAALRDILLDAFREQHADAPDPSSDEAALGDLDLVVEETKKSLSRKSRQEASFVAHNRRATVEVTRETFEEHTVDLVEQTLHYVDLVLADARAKGIDSLDEIILVGGMSQAPMIARALATRLAGKIPSVPEPRLIDPHHIVAKGAALFAARTVAEEYAADDPDRPHSPELGSSKPMELIDVTSRGYGVRAYHSVDDEVGHVVWIIKPQSELPASRSQRLGTLEHGQTVVKIVVYESATPVLSDEPNSHTKLITGDLTGLPPNKPAGQPVEVTHTLGTDGVLRIVATGPSGQRLDLEHQLRGEMPPEERAKPLPALAKY